MGNGGLELDLENKRESYQAVTIEAKYVLLLKRVCAVDLVVRSVGSSSLHVSHRVRAKVLVVVLRPLLVSKT